MIHRTYTLTENEMLRYYEFLVKNTPDTVHQRWRIASWIPVSCLFFLIILHVRNVYLWIMALLVSLVWIIFLSQLVFDDLTRTAAKRKLKERNADLTSVTFTDDNGVFTVDGRTCTAKSWAVYLDELIVYFDDGTVLVLPERVFEDNKEELSDIIRDVMKASENAERS